MGYLNKTIQSVTAHFTKRGREILANALSGDTSGDYIITQFALGDDEIDYGLWDETQPENLQGRILENMPVIESFVNQKEIMNSFIMVETPPIPYGSSISNVQTALEFDGVDQIIEIIPNTENHGESEEYEFFLEHDNIVEMTNPYTVPTSNFSMSIGEGDAPITDFIMSIITGGGTPPVANFSMNL
jgi:hypothetical protein|tara:strand:- start:1252 stop:1812 length:561 start_codon:yes stop_codon:yes gene_type:complete